MRLAASRIERGRFLTSLFRKQSKKDRKDCLTTANVHKSPAKLAGQYRAECTKIALFSANEWQCAILVHSGIEQLKHKLIPRFSNNLEKDKAKSLYQIISQTVCPFSPIRAGKKNAPNYDHTPATTSNNKKCKPFHHRRTKQHNSHPKTKQDGRTRRNNHKILQRFQHK